MTKDITKMGIDEVTQLIVDDLADIEMYGQLASRVLEIERTSRYDEAVKIFNFLQNTLEANKNLSAANARLYKKYQTLIVWLKFIALHVVLDDDLFTLFKNHLLEGVRLEIDIRQSVKNLFRASWDPYLRGEKRDIMLKAFSSNTEQFGPYKFTLGTTDRQLPATVTNLILDYNRLSKSDTERGGLEEASYFNQSPNVRVFSPRDRGAALKILQIYDFVRFPPLEEMAREMVVSPVTFPGEVTGVGPKRGLPQTPLAAPLPARIEEERPAVVIEPLELLKQKYQSYRSQRQSILRIEDAILVQTQGDAERLKKELASSSRQNDRRRVIACLKILAREKALVTALRDNPAWFTAVAEYIQKKYGGRYRADEVYYAVSNLKLEPTAPAAISEFLQYLLKEKLQMSESDSALVGVEIGQLLGGQYQSLAYGNQETGNFEWTKNKIVDKKLMSEIG